MFTQPKLPYMPDALAPVISQRTIEFHWGKHETAYISNLNKLTEGTEWEDKPLVDIIRYAEGALFNNASQAWNHIFYFWQYNPDGQKEPSGELRAAIERDFGSVEEFKKKFEEAGASLFGSGWVWLSADKDKNLIITQGKNAENPLRNDLQPILVTDVWEHAYYLDYQNRRADYLKDLWEILDWGIIEARFE